MQGSSQYYLRGEVLNEKGKLLPNVKILVQSKGAYAFFTGTRGGFGIPASTLTDSIFLYFEGYEPFKQLVDCNKYQKLVMKELPRSAISTMNRLVSVIKNQQIFDRTISFHSNESYNSLVENDFTATGKYPETGFALTIDRASYSNVRRFLHYGGRVPPDAVRIEELLNYFDFSRNKNEFVSDNTFSCQTTITSAPWSSKNQLLFINLQAPKIDVDFLQPTNLVFLIDISGSMDRENRLPLLQSAFKLLVKNLRAKDSVAIVTYGGGVGILLQPTSGGQKEKINNAIEQLVAGGDTPGEAGIRTAYQIAERSFNRNANNRIILATDGDFNVGQTSDKELEELINNHRQTGIYLTCLGVGMGNYKDSKLETLAKKGNGNFAYIDNVGEAEKVLIKEFTKTMYAVANDARISITFNPALVSKYRLIGFDNKKDALEDSTSEIEGGEVGSGHSLMAVFEVEPATDQQLADSSKQVCYLNLHYKLPGKEDKLTDRFSAVLNYRPIEQADSSLRFATAVLMFGELLKQSPFSKLYTWSDAEKLALGSAKNYDLVQTEFISLVNKAKQVYTEKKRKKAE